MNPKSILSITSLLLLCFCFFSFNTLAPKPGKKGKGKVNWITLEDAAAKIKKEPRKVIIDVYTDWCGWCKKMDQSTFTNPAVAEYINANFYAVKLDAEGKDPITINGKTYKYNPKYRSHEVAVTLLSGQMSYPSTVYLDEKMAILAPVPGYLDAAAMKSLLTYFGDNHYKKKSYQKYSATAAKK